MTARRAFGEDLRRHRERRGVSLEDIERETKIAKALFAGLERGDCAKWPGGLYSRAYVRHYAKAVGLDPEEIAARFVACFEATAAPDPASITAGRQAARKPELRLTLAPVETEISDIVMRARFRLADVLMALAVRLRGSGRPPATREQTGSDRAATQSA